MARPPIPSMGAPSMPHMSHTASAPPAASASVPAGPQLGGLFANGMPSLRKTRGAAVNTGRGASCKYQKFEFRKMRLNSVSYSIGIIITTPTTTIIITTTCADWFSTSSTTYTR